VAAIMESSIDGSDGDAIMWDPGAWLAERRSMLDRGEAGWLKVLADFDRDRLWQFDGQLSCVAWLMWKTKMARSTAFEKLRVAHALRRRPLIADAFDAGDLSWSAVRAVTQLDDPHPDVDAALVNLAKHGTVPELNVALRHYKRLEEQERPPDETRRERRGIRFFPGPDGLETAEITLDHLEMEELKTALTAFVDHGATAAPGAVDESTDRDPTEPAAANSVAPGRPLGLLPRWQLRADALLDLLRTAMAHLGGNHTTGADRYLIHLIETDTGTSEHLDGTPVRPAEAARARCDAGFVVHTYGQDGEILRLGRKTRWWNTAQRRAVSVRDRGTCRFPGCTNAASLCGHHHTLIHEGFTVSGNPDGPLTFYRSDGTEIGSTVRSRRPR
jgi:hypothetical protein